jgi:hypothetical protein
MTFALVQQGYVADRSDIIATPVLCVQGHSPDVNVLVLRSAQEEPLVIG